MRYFSRHDGAPVGRPLGAAALLLIAATLLVLALWGVELLRNWQDEPQSATEQAS